MAEEGESGRAAWSPGSGEVPASTRLLWLAGGLAGLGVVLAVFVMILWFTTDSNNFPGFGSDQFRAIQALGVVVQPLLFAAIVAALAGLTVALRERP